MKNLKNIIITVAAVAAMTAALASCGGNNTTDADGKNTDVGGGIGTVTTLADSEGKVKDTDESHGTENKRDPEKEHDGSDGLLGSGTLR